MELSFDTRRLRTLCREHEEAVAAIGAPAAEALRTRVADLRAVTDLADLPAGRPCISEGDPPQLRFPLREGWSLVTVVAHQDVPRNSEGELDTARVRRIRVQEIRQ